MGIGPFFRRACRPKKLRAHCILGLALLWSSPAGAQVPGRNVNMVSGTKWPEGDPFLERQNEPSIAASTRNPLHLVAGANDYRSVDLAGVPGSNEHGDAWLGIFKSFDGGQTWISTLLPGCKYLSAQCTIKPTAPFAGTYDAASDPVVRAGTNGLFYYSGIAFQRNQSAGVVFVARYVDNNNKENGDPIEYLGTSVVSSGNHQQFLDKPWIAVDVPRPGALTCNVNGESFLGGNVYISYAKFPVVDESHAAILFSRSRDCGITWSAPIQITDNSASNQGATFAIDPNSGTIYLAWRRFSQSAGSILVAKSTNGGVSFQPPVTVANLTAFDQSTSKISFRTNAYPSLTVDGDGRVYVAWSDRVGPVGAGGCGSGPCARIVVSSSTDGTAWSNPQLADPYPSEGHQWMPALTFSGGNLMLVYYDSRDDHRQGVLVCPQGRTCISTADYVEVLEPVRSDSPASVFTPDIADTPDLERRHTIDVRVTQSPPGATLNFSYPSVQISQYLFGSSTKPGASHSIDQLRFNVPNLPMFDSGTEAFLGDYIDITPTPTFIPVVTGTRTIWRYNLGVATGAVVQATWTDNRDVIPPPDLNWQEYTPPEAQTQSVFNPKERTPACSPKLTGDRNQNIYTSRIAAGVVAGSPGNTKPLSETLERGFVVFVENTSSVTKAYRLSIPPDQQPPGGLASFESKFVSPTVMPQLDVAIAPFSSISRTVFVTSADQHARVTVNVNEINALHGSPLSGPGTQTTIQLNPDLTNPDLTNPDLTNPNQTSTGVQSVEIYNPDLTNLGLDNPDLTNPDLTNPDLTNPDLTNPDLTNPDLTANGSPNPDLTNPDLTNPDLTNANITTPDLTNGSISDTFWIITNNGNTAAAYSVKLLLRGKVPPGVALQLLLYKVHTTPAAKDCTVVERPDNQLIANILNPVFSSRSDLNNPDLTNGAVTNATLSLAPGETARIDLRTAVPTKKVVFDPENAVTTVAVAQNANTNSGTIIPPLAASHITILNTGLPTGAQGLPYAATLTAAHSSGVSIKWAVAVGALPPGLTLNAQTGLISGTPNTLGTFPFTVTASDANNPSDADSIKLAITVVIFR